MKRFLKRFGLYIIPFLIIVLLFFMFEPYDYFLLRGDAPYDTMPLSSMREVIVEKPSRIILGDSKMANLNTDYIREITGKDYTMLGFGGAGIGECIELFWFATEHTQLEEVYFGISFYMVRGQYRAGRITEMERRATNMFRFMSDFQYWLRALNGAKEAAMELTGREVVPPEDPTSFELLPVPTEMGRRYRQDIEDYAGIIYEMCENYYIDYPTLDKIQEVIDYCNQHGIELTFVFTPTHESIYTMVTEPLGIDDITPMLKEFLIGKANVLDMEFLNDFTRNEDNFFDGFHLTGPQKKLLADLLFTNTPSDYIVRSYI